MKQPDNLALADTTSQSVLDAVKALTNKLSQAPRTIMHFQQPETKALYVKFFSHA
ncbi:hypothetical protein [Herbaspirillum frisingense]|uniref:Uncharacterized protein n=1 Tax=Herbaspirillum frisingense TaxID=92645 RepID=A0ABU1PIZ3_9BURK|nr:hypothetical protein [Herbaspirillum frisingense]MDR6585670.1 hypothetical protein [Herbaspirillum frisingense]